MNFLVACQTAITDKLKSRIESGRIAVRNFYPLPDTRNQEERHLPSVTVFPFQYRDEIHPARMFRPIVIAHIDVAGSRKDGLSNNDGTGLYQLVQKVADELRTNDSGAHDPCMGGLSTQPVTMVLQDPSMSDLSITISLLMTIYGKPFKTFH